ncbi:mitochondrial carrier homolog 2 isoform X4 [Chelonoidis abingdonii]|uniref:mitochondrial carrier homolog 2 isoform X4 n=1 Tax=Chelonoidis abingdonii TaxID=106734 RepID=UPI003F491BD1
MADAASQGAAGLRPHRAHSQPLMYVKVLSAVGYEPLPPTLGRNLFGRQVYQLPGLFAYAKHIMKIDGRAGLFKGLTPRLCSGAIGTIVHSQVLQRYQEADQEEEPGPSLKEPLSSLEQVIKETSREMVARSAATLVTHPFHVITLRCMVQFIGRETKYSGIFSPFVTIYREEGILGFFAGLVPRLLGDVLSLWLCNMLAYLINTYALENGVSTMSEMKSYSQAVTGAGWWPPSICTQLLLLVRLLEPAAQGGEHEPRQQPVFPEGACGEAVRVGGEAVPLRPEPGEGPGPGQRLGQMH